MAHISSRESNWALEKKTQTKPRGKQPYLGLSACDLSCQPVKGELIWIILHSKEETFAIFE